MNRSLPVLVAALFSHPALALGLGELVVQSPLGKPLRASVAVLDAPPDIQSDCFSLKNSGDTLPGVPDAQIRLETRGSHVTLFISTAQAVNEPAFQISVSAACADRLQRDYVVLLDPPLLAQPEANVAEVLPTRVEPIASTRQPAKRPRNRVAPVRARTVKLATDSPRAPADKKAASAQRALPEPHPAKLVLSGGRYRPDKLAATAVVRDASLPLAAASLTSTAMSPVELSDEHTSLKHRVAYLQTQLLALQQRNAELEAARRILMKAPAPTPVVAEKAVSRWTQFLIGLGILTAGGALFFGLRAYPRRRHAPLMNAPASPTLAFTDVRDAFPVAPTALSPEPLHAAPPPRVPTEPRPAEPDIFSSAIPVRGTEVNEDILDQAEVYVAHGHASLAIHMLQEYVRNAPTESPVPWLLLLDLLTREGPEAEYRATCAACKKYYNIDLSVASQDAALEGASLETYPHVIAHLQRVWGCHEARAFLADLLYDRRDGTRQGFAPGAYREIMLLRCVADAVGYGHRELAPLAETLPPSEARAHPELANAAAQRGPEPVLEWESPSPDPVPASAPTQVPEIFLDLTEWPVTHPASATLAELQQRVREAPTASPIPWLQLLDLLARDNLEAEFLAARAECQSLFNVNLTDPVPTNLFPTQASLEAYPHVVEQLQAVWHTPDAELLLSDLIYDQRGGIRQGFDLAAYREVLLLHALMEGEIFST